MHKPFPPFLIIVGILPSWLMLLMLAGCGRHISNLPASNSTIVCFGNSLTAGEGAQQGENYPSVLRQLTGRDVINAGVSGDTTRDALARIERDVLSREPGLVIVEFGANDRFQQIPKSETIANLGKIVNLIQAAGAAVVLVEVRMHLMDPYIGAYKRIAREKKALLIPNILAGIITDPGMKSDQMHPNARGYVLMATRIHEKIKPYLR